jgi:ABC-type antimicrobial peptide transport system permease subunit
MFYTLSTSPVMTVLIKTNADPNRFSSAVRAAIQLADPETPVSKIHPLARNVADSLARRRLALTLLGIFGAMAALLTAAGVYGLMAYSVNTRIREFGVRAAVGASPAALVAMILRQAVSLMAPGLLCGFVLALAFSTVMRRFVYRLSPLDPWSLAAAAVVIILLTLLSAWIPARSTSAVDLAAALKADNY